MKHKPSPYISVIILGVAGYGVYKAATWAWANKHKLTVGELPSLPTLFDFKLKVKPVFATDDLHDQGPGKPQAADRRKQAEDTERNLRPQDVPVTDSAASAKSSMDAAIAKGRAKAQGDLATFAPVPVAPSFVVSVPAASAPVASNTSTSTTKS